jgi:hypothetical protein
LHIPADVRDHRDLLRWMLDSLEGKRSGHGYIPNGYIPNVAGKK